MNGALLVNKGTEISSFGIIESLQNQWIEKKGGKRRDAPKLGHGGTLDPFATGLLIVLCGRAVKLARYFLGSRKSYEGVFRFGETTIPGDPTAPISETSTVLPESLNQLQDLANRFSKQPYLQTPPMHSAKKRNGKPLYELARAGIEVEREPKLCHLYQFEILDYTAPRASFRVQCSSGTYIRTLAQDFGRLLGSVALLETLHRTSSGIFHSDRSWTFSQISEAVEGGQEWDKLPCWIPFDRLLDGFDRADATEEERLSLIRGQQGVLFNILKRARAPQGNSKSENCLAIYCKDALVAIARKDQEVWSIERVFTT